MFIAGRYLIWSTPCFQTGISFFEIQGVGLFQQTSLSSLSCLPSVKCHRRCFDPLLYSFFVSCMCPAVLILFYSHTFCPTMLNSLVPLLYRATQSLVSHSILLAKSTSTSPSLLLFFCLVCGGCRRCTSPPLFLVCLSFVFPS